MVNIHGSEYVHLSQTCQSLFGPLSHNLLVPEVAVGECIRLLLPVSNPFQTPLLMRKLRLIWKFTDAADPENSYFSNTDLEKAAECVKVEPIERYSISRFFKICQIMACSRINSLCNNTTGLFDSIDALWQVLKNITSLILIWPNLDAQAFIHLNLS